MKQKYRILKLNFYTYITQTLSPGNFWYGIGNYGYKWETKEDQMKYCRTYTLFGAKLAIRKQIRKKVKHKTLTELFKNAQVVYEVEVDT